MHSDIDKLTGLEQAIFARQPDALHAVHGEKVSFSSCVMSMSIISLTERMEVSKLASCLAAAT